MALTSQSMVLTLHLSLPLRLQPTSSRDRQACSLSAHICYWHLHWIACITRRDLGTPGSLPVIVSPCCKSNERPDLPSLGPRWHKNCSRANVVVLKMLYEVHTSAFARGIGGLNMCADAAFRRIAPVGGIIRKRAACAPSGIACSGFACEKIRTRTGNKILSEPLSSAIISKTSFIVSKTFVAPANLFSMACPYLYRTQSVVASPACMLSEAQRFRCTHRSCGARSFPRSPHAARDACVHHQTRCQRGTCSLDICMHCYCVAPTDNPPDN
jgi:hypothetical protein